MTARLQRSAAAYELPLVAALFAIALGIGSPGLRGAYYFNDVEHFNLPVRGFFADGWRQGELRWWCAEAGAGFPLFAEGQSGAAYPGNGLFAVIRPAWLAYSWSVILHVWWAGLGVALLLRTFGVRRSAALAGAVAYMLSAPLWFRVIHLNFLHGLAWLPWVAVGLERGLQHRRGGFAVAAVALAMQVLAGHAHPPMLTALFAPLYVLFRGAQVHRPDRAGRWQVPAVILGLLLLIAAAVGSAAARWLLLPGLIGALLCLRAVLTSPPRRAFAASFAGLGAMFALAGLLSAVQVLPLLELVPHTGRQAGLSVERAQDPELTLTWRRLSTLLLPRIHGSAYQDDVGEKIRWDLATQWEHAAHVGILTVLLLLLAPLVGRRPERWVFCGLAILALLLAMGSAFPFYGWLLHLPGWGSIRGPARMLGLFAFAAAVLAGLVIDDLAEHGVAAGDRKRVNLILFPTALLGGITACAMILQVAGGGVFGPTHTAAYVTGWARLAALLGCGAALLASRKGPAPSPGWAALAAALMVLDLATGSAGYHRVQPPSYFARPPVADRLADYPDTRIDLGVYADRHPLQANRSLLYPPVQNVAIYTPLALSRQQRIVQLLRDDPPPWLAARWRGLLRIGFTDLADDGRWRLDPVLGADGRPLRHFPPVWTTPLWHQADSPDDALRLCLLESWRPAAYAILETPVAPAPRQGSVGEVLWSELGRHRKTCRVSSRSPQVVVVGECGYPGWQVHREGTWQPAARVDYLFFGTKVPAGVHRVDFVFRPLSIRLGLFCSLLGCGILAFGWRRLP